MILQRYAIAVLAAITLISATAMNTLACACCSEPGTYYLRTAKPDSYEIDLISQFRFAPKAKLYMTEAGFEMIEGLDTVKKEDEAMEASISDGFDLAAALPTAGFGSSSFRPRRDKRAPSCYRCRRRWSASARTSTTAKTMDTGRCSTRNSGLRAMLGRRPAS